MKDRQFDGAFLQADVPPELLDGAILSGIRKGKKKMNQKKYIVRTVGSAAAAFAIFVGSINASPAFAAKLEDVAVLGTLVHAFQWNETSVKGGQASQNSRASVALEKNGVNEQLTLTFDGEQAARYEAVLAHFPETVTITLPDTKAEDVKREVEDFREKSDYIKAVHLWQTGQAASLQIEFDLDTAVGVEEYENPGRIVVKLAPGEFEGRDIYSVRTLSAKDTGALEQMQNGYGETARVLLDEQGKPFVELRQFDTQAEAERFLGSQSNADSLIVEKRWSNNAPASYDSRKAYENAQIEREYLDLLNQSTDIQPVQAFLEKHFTAADEEVREALLSGLTGWLAADPEQYDLEKLNQYYKAMGQDIYQALGVEKK